MLIFHSTLESEKAFQEMSPEALQASLERWTSWLGGLESQGRMHGTNALLPAGKVLTAGGTVITDGPYTEGKEIVGGYALIGAASLEEACQLARNCPHFDTNGTVEVRPVQKFD